MSDLKTYLWKELNIYGKYISISQADTISFSLDDINRSFVFSFYEESFGWENYLEDFLSTHNEAMMPLKAKKLIDELLRLNNITGLNIEFYILACIFQKTYIHLKENPRNMSLPGMKDFQNESKELKILLQIIHDNLNNIPPKVASISFKGKKTETVKNFLIVNDILRFLAESYNLTLENFERRKKELLDNTNNVKFDSLDEFYKYYFSLSLNNYISNVISSDSKFSNEHLKFVLKFLHISQIPIKRNYFEVPNSLLLDDYSNSNDLKYLHTFLSRSKSFFIK